MNKINKSLKLTKSFIVHGIEMSNSKRIAEELNLKKSDIGTKISNSIPETNEMFVNYLNGNNTTTFFMQATDIHEIKLVTHKLKNKKTRQVEITYRHS